MEKAEFIEKARALGYDETYIAETIALHENAKAEGIVMDFADDLLELPVR